MAKWQRWLILAIVSSSLFLIVVDSTILYTALPTLTHDLHATGSEKLWIVNAYPLVMAGLLLSTGTLGDRFGHKRLFLLGLIGFGIATLVCAFAPTPTVLIIGRALLAIGASMMMPATLSLIRLTFSDEAERAMAIGIWSSIAAGAAGLGPVLSGALLEHFWWGAVFLINVPVVIIALVVGYFVIPAHPPQPDKPWDFISSLQVMVGLIGVIFAIKEISKLDASYTVALVSGAIGIIALGFFVRRQRTLTYPLVSFDLFKNHRLLSGVIGAFISTFALAGIQLVMTQRIQLVLNMSPLEAGTYIMAMPIASFVAGFVIGALIPRLGTSRILWMQLSLAIVGLIIYLNVMDGAQIIQTIALILYGFGLGGAMTAASSAVMGNAPAERAGMAASVEEVSYELGTVLGVALMGSLLSFIYASNLTVPATLDAPESVYSSIDEARLVAESLPAADAQALLQAANQAFDQAFVAVFIGAIICLIVMTALIWGINRGKPDTPMLNPHGH